jgi:creatinine amidohydrolase
MQTRFMKTALSSPKSAAEAGLRANRVLDWQTSSQSQLRALDPARTVAWVSCSPIEVHGPHLPTWADLREAEGLTEASIDKLLELDPEIRFVRLPPIGIGTDVLPQPGSLRFSPQTVVRVMEELGDTLARQGFRHIWVSSFHGGPRHVLALEQAAHRVNKRHPGTKMVSVFSLLLTRLTGGSSDLAKRLGGIGGISAEELKGDSHGGLIETAILLHLCGDAVGEHRGLPPRSLEIQQKEQGKPPMQKGERPTFVEMLKSLPLRQRYYETETYAGAPAKATAALGAKYLDELAGDSAEALLSVWNGTTSPDAARSPLWKLRHVLMNRAFGWAFDKLFASPGPRAV